MELKKLYKWTYIWKWNRTTDRKQYNYNRGKWEKDKWGVWDSHIHRYIYKIGNKGPTV